MTCRAVAGAVSLPSAPFGLTLQGTDTAILLDWEDNFSSEDVTNYKVYRATNQGGPFTLKSSPTASTYTDSTGVSGTTYWYRVSAVNAGGEGPYTDITGSFTLDSTAPDEVTITTGPLQVGTTATRITWTPPANADYAGCKVYAKMDSGSYSLISGATLVTANLFDHTSATAGHNWTYKITTKDVAGNESTGTISSLIPVESSDTTIPDPPVNLFGTSRSDGILLSWTPNTEYDLASYRLRRHDLASVLTTFSGLVLEPTNYLDETTVVGTFYNYSLTAIDTSDNESDESEELVDPLTRLSTSMYDLTSFIKSGTMAPCVAHARGIDKRVYTAVTTNGVTVVSFSQSLDFQALSHGTLLTADYSWDFASGSGQPDGLFSRLKGFNGAHAYDSPGNYTITLTRTDEAGKIDQFQGTVNIAPDTRTKVYCTPTGDNSSTNTGTNSSFPVSPARAQSILAASDNVTVRLQNGQKFNTSASLFTITRTNSLIEGWSFGTASSVKAVVQFNAAPTGTRALITVKSSAKNCVVQNLTFDRSYSPAGDTQISQDQGVNISGDGNTLVRGITINKIGSFIGLDGSTNTSRYVLVQSCDAPNKDSINQYFSFSTGQDLVYLSNKVANSQRQHIIRASEHSRTLVALNDFTNMDRRAVDAFDYSKTVVNVQHGCDFYLYKNTLTADITTDADPSISKQEGSVDIGPLRDASGHKDEYLKNVVIEANTINAKLYIKSGLTDCMIRNNIINRPDSTCLNYDGLGGNDATGAAYFLPCARIYIYNNTLRNAGATGVLVKLGGTIDNFEFTNNHGIASSISSNANLASCMNLVVGFGTSNLVKRNCFPLTANFRVGGLVETLATFNTRSQAAGSNTKETTTVSSTFKPSGGTIAASFARPKSGVFDDIAATTRVQNALTWTCGAYQT